MFGSTPHRPGTRTRAVQTLALAVALCTATLARAQCPAPGAARGTLTVAGQGETSRPPDTASVAISLLTRGPTLDGTSRDHRQRVASAAPVIERLKAQGVTVDEGSFSLSEERAPVSAGARPKDEPPTYRAATRYDLTVAPLDRLDAIVAGIVASGLFEIKSVRFSVADSRAALDDARRAAMADAQRQARVYADAADLRLDAIDTIVDGQAAGRGDGAYDLPERLARTASVGITAPKALAFSGSVTVTWHVVPR